MIAIQHVSRRFGDALAVDDVSLTIERGTVTAVVGTSGSGKSTLLRMINRLIEPTSGTIRIDGQNTATVPGETLRRGIGYVIQGHGLFPHWTVARNVATVPELLGWDRARIERRVRELLTMLQLDPDTYASKYPHQLSGGQQQRVGVARAIAAEPRVLLMDEPFGALDPVIRTQAQADLLALQQRLGITVVLVTHDVEEAIHLGDRVAVMDKGKLLQVAAPAAILAHPQPGLVARLIGTSERALRLLSLATVADAVEPGAAEGQPVRAEATLRTALSDLLWQDADSLPVVAADGSSRGRITLRAILARAAAPADRPA